MKTIYFSKYQGTGNDFVMLNNMNGEYDFINEKHVQLLCNRRFGIGGDGLIKINRSSKSAFEVDYFNSDGSKSFCGNGARCSLAFSESIGIHILDVEFSAIDGLHRGGKVRDLYWVEMLPVKNIEKDLENYILNTGSPHYVHFCDDVKKEDIVLYGKQVRYSERFKTEGINVNISQVTGNGLKIRTYERGVEDETLSCGTGATACALAYAVKENMNGHHEIDVDVEGGKLKVSFAGSSSEGFDNIRLIGPAQLVFEGEFYLD
ncbi:MAG: diaminopimelate epimerase [Bacteroidetes bacterium]|nr:MAG: diaminopimelate epimerase [Bacteroidota bacterium]